MTDAIRFLAQVVKVQSIVDGSIRVTMDLSEQETRTAMLLMDCKRQGGMIEVAAVPVIQGASRKDAEVSTRSEWEPEGTT